jgi:NTP pyrophosphatase (non-canonical NTP hydrolase)
MPDTLKDLQARLSRFAEARDWGQFHSPKNLATALTVEASELLEIFQWMPEEASRSLPDEPRGKAKSEIADVLLYLVQLSSALGIDPVTAAQEKLELNEQRYPVDLARGNSKKYNEF